jgi:polysaccharide pyruvyl transferase WcaK-like protein
LRDENSKIVLEDLGIANAEITADPAFYLEASKKEVEHILESCQIGGTQKYCVISVRPWKFNDAEFEQKLAQICLYAQEKYRILPLFFPMQPPRDFQICADISAEMLKRDKDFTHKSEAILLNRSLPIEEILGVIAGAEFIIGMRLHTLIYAASMAVPVIGLVYDPKVGAFMDDVAQSYKQNVEDVDVATICRYIDEIMQSKDEISGKLAVVSKSAKEKAKRNAEIAVELL